MLDHQHIVGECMSLLMHKPQVKLEWVVTSISDCAGDSTGIGLALPAVQKALRAYIRNSRAPKVIDAPAGRQEPAMAKGIDYRELKPPKQEEQAQVLTAAETLVRVKKLTAGIGGK